MYEIRCAERGDVFIFRDSDMVWSPYGVDKTAHEELQDQTIASAVVGPTVFRAAEKLPPHSMLSTWLRQVVYFTSIAKETP